MRIANPSGESVIVDSSRLNMSRRFSCEATAHAARRLRLTLDTVDERERTPAALPP